MSVMLSSMYGISFFQKDSHIRIADAITTAGGHSMQTHRLTSSSIPSGNSSVWENFFHCRGELVGTFSAKVGNACWHCVYPQNGVVTEWCWCAWSKSLK